MSFEPFESSIGGRDLLDIPRCFGTRDHDDRQTQGARGGNLRISRIAAGVLGHQHINAFTLHQRALSCLAERRAVANGDDVRNRQRIADGLDGSDPISVLRGSREGREFETPNGEESAAGPLTKSLNRCVHGRNIDPAIAVLPRPRRTAQGEQRHTGLRAGLSSIVRHDRGKGMGCIDDRFDALIVQETDESLHTAETADAGWNRQRARVAGATGQGQKRAKRGPTCKPRRERGGFSRAAQKENAHEPLFSEF